MVSFVDKVFSEYIVSPLLELTYLIDDVRATNFLMRSFGLLLGALSIFRAPDMFRQDIGIINDRSQLLSSYDFIVVGGGISGCLVAKRLSDKDFTVLLIHGPEGVPDFITRLPLFNSVYYGDPKTDHMYLGPSLNTSYWKNNKVLYSSGKYLGGSQLLSAQMWSYGKSGDYSCWKNRFNISEKFNYSNIRKYGAMHESADEGVVGVDFEYGREGEIGLSHADNWEPFNNIRERFEKRSAKITGTKVVKDHNSDTLGFGKIVHAVEKETGYISTPTRAFFEKGYKKDKLHIITEHMVTKILFNGDSTPVATGVVVLDLKSEKTFEMKADKRVVLTAGAVRTPQLLTLSGVGPEDVMKRFNVSPVLIKEGVGKNLHDHYDLGGAGICFDRGTLNFTDIGLSQITDFVINGKGPIRQPFETTSLGFFKSKQNLTTCPDPDDRDNCRPDFEYILQSITMSRQLAASHFLHSGATHKQVVDDFYMMNKPKPPKSYFDAVFKQKECLFTTVTLLHPEGRGQITLKSNDPLENPVVDLNTVGNERDVKLMGELWQTVKRISDEAFYEYGGKFNDDVFPECENIIDRTSIEFGSCQIKPYLKTAWHMSGTCRLGQETDRLAVVNEDFHVIGVSNLVVADASLLPCPTSGHMLATTSALAEMAAQNLIELFK